MFGTNTARKLISYKKIKKMPVSFRKRAVKVYNIIDRIEFLTVSPWYFSMLSPVLVFVGCSNFKWPKSDLLLIFLTIASYFLSVLVLKLILNIWKRKKIRELKVLVQGRFKYQQAFKKIQELDPATCRNSGINKLGLLN